ncbi:MAG: hypothetical protein R3E97_12265 [Candidatus Eisenbacteria bacterium]
MRFVEEAEGFLPYARNTETLARGWAIPGVPGLEHRVGGPEKQEITGNVSYSPANHERMIQLREEKIARIANSIPLQTVDGADSGELLVIGWGSTYGAITAAVRAARAEGRSVGQPPT